MSLSINTNRVDVAKQVETEFAQGPVQKEKVAFCEESRFILMKANQHATLDKLGLADNAHRDYELASEDCSGECPCECDLDCVIKGCGYEDRCPCPNENK